MMEKTSKELEWSDKVYLDWNIIVSINCGEVSFSQLRDCFEPGMIFPFSHAHISEAIEIRGENENVRLERIKSHFETLTSITDNNYLYPLLNSDEIRLTKESPENVLETVTEISGVQNIIKSFTNLVSVDYKKAFRESLGLKPVLLNDMTSKEIVDHLSKTYEENGLSNSFINFIESPPSHLFSSYYGWMHKASSVFTMLDLSGYWKDKYTSSSDYARHWDSTHACFASYCEHFISDDLRTRKKAEVLYEMYNIPTKILSLNEVLL